MAYCERTGPFRRSFRTDFSSLFFGGEYRSRPTDGTEFDSKSGSFRIGGSRSFGGKTGDGNGSHSDGGETGDDNGSHGDGGEREAMAPPPWSFEGHLEIDWIDYRYPSVFDPEARRNDREISLELGLLHNIGGRRPETKWRHLDLSLNASYSWYDSDVEEYDDGRWMITIGIQGRHGGFGPRENAVGQLLTGSGSTRVKVKSGAGSSSPQVVSPTSN
jgi:hypothetical protein